jgi:5-(carboxyamino)imidazole ribonucleotide mutase
MEVEQEMPRDSLNVKVGIIMGSDSDHQVMSAAALVLEELGIGYEVRVVSAHRTPEVMFDYAKLAEERGIEVIIAGAGGSAHLPGMVASLTSLPVIGVPVKSNSLDGLDSFLSIVQMPAGVPVAAVGKNASFNAGLLAARILSITDESIRHILKNRQNKYENVYNDFINKKF